MSAISGRVFATLVVLGLIFALWDRIAGDAADVLGRILMFPGGFCGIPGRLFAMCIVLARTLWI